MRTLRQEGASLGASTIAAISQSMQMQPAHMQNQQPQVQPKVFMHSPDQQRARHLTQLLRKIGIGQIARSEEILKRGCGAVSEPANTTPSPVFLRGALAQRTRTCNHWETVEQLADRSPPFGQRILNLDDRQNLGGNQSDRFHEFEQNRSVTLSSIIPD